MVAFTKKIIPPGTYSVPTPGKPNTRQEVEVDPARIQHWVDTFNEMKANGLRIPAPFRHDPLAIPFRTEGDAQDVDAYKNAGWWTELSIDEEGHLQGTLEVPSDEDSEKIGKTVVEVSPLAKAHWEDGNGNEYDDAITHIALVTHPVVPGQENFKPRSKQYKELAASHTFSSENLVMAYTMTTSIQDLLDLLSGAVGVQLPKDTDAESFFDRLRTALTALKNAPEGDETGSVKTPPRKLDSGSNPVAFSAEETMPTKFSYDPFTGKEVNEEEATKLLSTLIPEVKLSQEDQATINYARKVGQQAYVQRIENLVNSGRVNPKFAKDKLEPFLSDLQLSFDVEGTPVSGNLDLILESLESLPAGTTLTGETGVSLNKSKGVYGNAFSLAANMQEEEIDPALLGTQEMNEEDVDKLVNAQLHLVGQ